MLPTTQAMFTNLLSVHIPAKLTLNVGAEAMAAVKSRIIHKHFRLDAVKLKRAQGSRLAAEANQKFLRSGVTIRDVFGTLTE